MFQLLMRRTRGLAGPMFQPCRTGGLVHGVGNAHGSGGALAGVRPVSAAATDATHITVNYTACAAVVTLAQIEIQIDGGAWQPVTAVSGSPGSVHVYTVPTMVAGDVVRIRAAVGALEDCDVPANPIDAFNIPVANDLVLAGDFILLESGGADVILLEDAAADPADGITLENAP